MLTKYKIIQPGSFISEIKELDWPEDPGYDLIRSLVDSILMGGSLEHVSVWASFDSSKFQALDMFVDDCGLLKHLPRNEVATEHYRRANQVGRSAIPKVADVEKLSFICGVAILFNRRVWF